MSNCVFTCMGCDAEMTFEQIGGGVTAVCKGWNDAALFFLCKSCQSKKPSANQIVARLQSQRHTKLRHRRALATLNIVNAIHSGNLRNALEFGHDCPEFLKMLAESDESTLIPAG